MGFGNIGISGLLIMLVIALVIFGPSKLPELGRAFGRTLREFKAGTHDLLDDKPVIDVAPNSQSDTKQP